MPDWATDYYKRHDSSLNTPLALYERIKGGLRLAAIDAEAARGKLEAGQNLADARALLPRLTTREIDRPLLEAAFADFADWHSNASPLVAVMTDISAFGDLVLDITGAAHLFGGEKAMLDMLLMRLHGLGYSAFGAIAPTIGAAWALSHFAPGQIIAPEEIATALAPLPVTALRLPPEQAAGLINLGLKRIGQLPDRNRKALQARFGSSLIMRIDQALGHVEERINPRLPIVEHYAERRFVDPIGLIDDVLMCAHDLAIQLAIRLEAKGLGAQTFHLFLYRVDHQVIQLSVNAGRTTRDPAHISRLFTHRSERLAGEYDAGFGIDMIRLAATSLSALDNEQANAFDQRDAATDLNHLHDRMTSRLGPLGVVRSVLYDTHIPERAVRLVPAIAAQSQPSVEPARGLQRPLRLLPTPEAITVMAQVPDAPPAMMVWRRVTYRFAKASGPERIAAEWWAFQARLALLPPDEEANPSALKLVTAPNEPLPLYGEGEHTRDYYIAEDEAGRRFWLFRIGLYEAVQNPLWFLHGFFS